MNYPELEMISNEDDCDVIFVVQDQRISAHIKFLSLKSIVFRELFTNSNDCEAKDKLIMSIQDFSFSAFKSLIHYLYCDELIVQDSNNLQLFVDMIKLSENYKTYKYLDVVSKYINSKQFLNVWPQNERILRQIKLNDIITRITRRTSVNDKCPEADYFMNESLSDVVLIINKERIPALRQLLIIKSRVF